MSLMCAHCCRVFTRASARYLIWCREDGSYVCEPCWHHTCKSGHGKGSTTKGKNLLVSYLLVMLFLIAPLMLGTVIIYSYHLYSSWDSLEPTNISDIRTGETIRIDGVINESWETVAIGGEEVARKGWHWEWNHTCWFELTDETGSIMVSTEYFWTIEKGPHEAPNRVETDGTCYRGGDNITVIGVVSEKGGQQFIYLRWVGTDPDDIGPTHNHYLLLIIMLVILIVPIAIFGAWGWFRRFIHTNTVKCQTPIYNHNPDPHPGSEVGWNKNRIFRRKTTHRVVTSVGIIWSSLCLITVLGSDILIREVFFMISFITIMLYV